MRCLPIAGNLLTWSKCIAITTTASLKTGMLQNVIYVAIMLFTPPDFGSHFWVLNILINKTNAHINSTCLYSIYKSQFNKTVPIFLDARLFTRNPLHEKHRAQNHESQTHANFGGFDYQNEFFCSIATEVHFIYTFNSYKTLDLM